jgi:hypothetical protein
MDVSVRSFLHRLLPTEVFSPPSENKLDGNLQPDESFQSGSFHARPQHSLRNIRCHRWRRARRDHARYSAWSEVDVLINRASRSVPRAMPRARLKRPQTARKVHNTQTGTPAPQCGTRWTRFKTSIHPETDAILATTIHGADRSGQGGW